MLNVWIRGQRRDVTLPRELVPMLHQLQWDERNGGDRDWTHEQLVSVLRRDKTLRDGSSHTGTEVP